MNTAETLTSPIIRKVTIALGAIAALAYLLIAFTADDPFFLYPFRESQTAISADYLLREPAGGMLAYQLPILGTPWRIPLEFPLFQQLTAWVASLGISVAQSGRLVSLVFFILCVATTLQLWRKLELPNQWAPIFAALLIASPIYGVFSTAHLIESLALFLGLMIILGSVRLLQGASWAWLAVVAVFGALAAMVKITTWLPCALAATLYAATSAYHSYKNGQWSETRKRHLAWVLAMGLGFLAGVLWSVWSKNIRNANPLGEAGANLSWVSGTLKDHLSPKLWALLLGKHSLLLFGPLGLLAPVVLILAWFKGGGVKNRVNQIMLAATMAYLAHVLVFFNLNLIHDYYLFEEGLFLLLAVACALITLLTHASPRWTWAPLFLATSMLLTGLAYGWTKCNYHDFAFEQAGCLLKQAKQPGAFVTFGFDWSSRVPFEAGRKALMLSDRSPTFLTRILETNKQVEFFAVASIGNDYAPIAKEAAQRLKLDVSHPVQFWFNGCVYFNTNDTRALSNFNFKTDNPLLEELFARTPQADSGKDRIVFKQLNPFAQGAPMEIIYKRGSDAFVFQPARLKLCRVRCFFHQNPPHS
jgi:hypothetical protein